MLILLYGQDTYRSREETRKIIGEQEKASLDWFNFVRIDAKEKDAEIFAQVRQAVNTASMFSEKKLIILENIFSAPDEIQEEIMSFLKDKKLEKDSETTIIFWAGETETKNNLLEFMKKNAECRKFEPLKEAQLRDWVKKYITNNNGTIEGQALDLLIDRVGSDLWRMSNEINKLLSHKNRIGISEIELLIKSEIDMNVFDIVDAIGLKNKIKALKLMGDYFEKGEDEIRLLGMFVYQFRNLIKVKSAPNDNLGLHPFVLKKTREQAKNFSLEELKKIYYHLLTIDFSAKLGKAEATCSLELLVTGL